MRLSTSVTRTPDGWRWCVSVQFGPRGAELAAAGHAPIPTRQKLRIATGESITRWARARGLKPHDVHRTLNRYGGRMLDMDRVWGPETRRVLRALVEAVEAVDVPRPPPSRDTA